MFSSNRIKIQVILLILQLENRLLSPEMLHSKQWHYSLHRDFQNCNSTRRSPTGFFSSNSSSKFYKGTHTSSTSTYNLHMHTTIQRILHPASRIQFHIQKTESSSSTTIYRGQRDLHSRKENSTHRRQGDLLEIHPCVLQDLPRTFQSFQSSQIFQSFMTFQPIQAILQVPVPPGFPPHYSILQLECIFYIFYKFYSSIGFHRKLH